MKSELLISLHDNTIFIKASGHLTAMLCTDLRKEVQSRMDSSTNLLDIVVDLSLCSYMDSTFMGLLVGLNKKLQEYSDHKLVIYHPAEQARHLLEGLGLRSYLNFDFEEDFTFPDEMEIVKYESRATADFILRAHEHLSDLSRENRMKFATLRKVLKEQTGKE